MSKDVVRRPWSASVRDANLEIIGECGSSNVRGSFLPVQAIRLPSLGEQPLGNSDTPQIAQMERTTHENVTMSQRVGSHTTVMVVEVRLIARRQVAARALSAPSGPSPHAAVPAPHSPWLTGPPLAELLLHQIIKLQRR
ncbi:unnamed protein product [Danaus chrysippus]|uniref:(African queen) hypothetical protein n=1 Tax=Danaus chrysippus TaxID=151541 RepID=A0A8J2RAQ3_9NEOP|nr:unnamed protein product [Danaus chrysippus]